MHALLAFDTTGAFCTVALRRPGRDDLVHAERIGRGHAERLAPMVEAILNEAELAPAGIGRIGVAVGPGSFAGSRVGVAFARGLALAVGAETAGISNLAVLALMADPRGQLDVAVIHDAKRGDLVVQAFTAGSPVGAPERLTAHEARDWLTGQLERGAKVTGSGAVQLMTQLQPGWVDDIFTEGPELSPRALLDLAERAHPASPSPFYARPPDAKLPGGRSPA
ncbi:MAG: tRNA (adenosine(37)-N6)-threonylcarbamoyltransferase complex dimerization subunit type 1 TsaB [Maricaulis sp.]|nr:tRNA (adenosine(37)-N6)-threonylcarbamoyltransferase complex dimerization subunit type 1 TsaB [Maricaulis sp.]HAQ34332.1 tRNA (adenosine(37)-N6)-threonylcarbamoyltransferase complex dimerization subunit type 1 TsaB [Alphaproteobacteria bacterium]